jgi:hypothetical protein
MQREYEKHSTSQQRARRAHFMDSALRDFCYGSFTAIELLLTIQRDGEWIWCSIQSKMRWQCATQVRKSGTCYLFLIIWG